MNQLKIEKKKLHMRPQLKNITQNDFALKC